MMPTLRSTASIQLILATLLMAGCGGSSSSSAAPPSLAAPPSALLTDAPSPSVDAGPPVIDPGIVDPEPALQLLWKGEEPASSESDWVTNPTVDPEGRIWGGAATTGEFWLFDRDGTHLDSWDATSRQDSVSRMFGGIAFGREGRIYVVDAAEKRVLLFDPGRTMLDEWGGFGDGPSEFYLPNRIATDPAGNVYVHDVESGAVKKFDADGTPIVQYELDSYPSMAVDTDGHIHVVTKPRKLLQQIAPDGTVVRSIDVAGLVRFPIGIRIEDDGTLWLCSIGQADGPVIADRLLEFGPDGKLRRLWQDVAFEEFAIDPAGDQLYTSVLGQPFLAAYALPAD
jgi:sugar lactone lactonase YvrE